MSTTVSSMDATSKRWLAALALASVVAVTVLARSFINALSPAEKSDAKMQQAVSDRTEEVRTVSRPEWIRSESFPAVEEPRPANASPFEGGNVAMRKPSEAARQEMIHQQAEYLRQQSAKSTGSDGLGHLTPDKINEMEKNGIGVW